MARRDDPRFSEEQLRRILDRAMDLDRESTASLTESDILSIGTEVGISRVALMRSIAEESAVGPPDSSPGRSPLPGRGLWSEVLSAGGLAVGGALALLLGMFLLMLVAMLALSLDPRGWGFFDMRDLAASWIAMGTALAALMGALIRGVAIHTEVEHRRFQIANACMWLGLVVVSAFAFETSLQNYAWLVLLQFGAASAFGGAFFFIGRRLLGALRGPLPGGPGGEPGVREIARSWRSRIADWVQDLLDPQRRGALPPVLLRGARD